VVSAKGGFVEPLKKAVDTFRTTSPSYPIMGSVEYAVKYPVNDGLAMAVAEWKKDRDYCYQNDDYTKLCLFVKDGFQAEEMAHIILIVQKILQTRAHISLHSRILMR
jgi:hypothetical protein